MKTKIAIAIAITTLLSACYSVPVSPDTAVGVPDHRVFRKELIEKRPGTQEVRFVRDTELLARAEPAILDLNKDAFVALQRGEKVSIWLPPGKYKFGAISSMNDFLAQWRTEIEIDVESGGRYVVRVIKGDLGPKLEWRAF